MKDDTISRAMVEIMRKAKDKSEAHRMLVQLLPENGRDEKKLREELLSAQPECDDCIKHGGNICPPCPKVPECEDAVYRKAVQMLLAYFVPEERYAEAVDGLRRLPPAQSGWTKDVKDILAYIDAVVHPLVSPENWNVYSELHDMVSGLLKSCEGEQE